VPVCHVLVDGKVCFGTGSDSQKVRNLQADPHLAVPVDLYSEDWKFIKGIMLQGLPGSSIVGPRSGRFEHCCTGNTRSTPTRPVGGEADSMIVEMTPTRVFSWNVDE